MHVNHESVVSVEMSLCKQSQEWKISDIKIKTLPFVKILNAKRMIYYMCNVF